MQLDVIDKLRLKNPEIIQQSFVRAALSYSSFKIDSKINKIIEVLRNVPGSSVVYCRNRRQTQEVTRLLRLQHFSADYYHAGLARDERSRKQDEWIGGKIRVIVCTNAFGMGIDKPDVRSVIHYGLPDSLENYYQEAGRGGRDNKRAYAVAVFQQQDLEELRQMPELRFPAITQIKAVYQSIADYLDIPVGLGEGNYYDFDLLEFSKNFKYDVHLVMNVLKALEHEGHLSFNEYIFLPSQVNFTTPKELLEDFETSHPGLEPLVKCLLRTYEGIYDNRVSVNEKNIARLTMSTPEKVRAQLTGLKAFGIIEYLPQKETPQIYFLLNRAPAEFLHINTEAYLARKQLYEQRVNTMISYVGIKTCRSQFIAAYFGQDDHEKCGICDNCLNERAGTLSEEEFRRISEKILGQVPKNGIDVKALLLLLKDTRKEKVWTVLNFLQTERKLQVVDNMVMKAGYSSNS